MSCQFPGTPDMYGLGIRVGFYTLWFASELAVWLARPVLPVLRIILPLFTSATFLGLIIRTAWGTLLPVEVYVVLLLVYGTYYCLLPFYAFRLATGCSPYWDPNRWPLVEPSRVWMAGNFLLVLAITIFQIWFWCTGINALPQSIGVNAVQAGCTEWGYFLAMVPLTSAVYIAFNLLFMFILLLAVFVHLCYVLGVVRPPRYLRKMNRKADKRGIPREQQVRIQAIQTASNIIVLAVVIVGVELVIQWNGIDDVSDLSMASQLIPLIVGSGLLIYVIYLAFFLRSEEDGSEGSSGSSGSSRSASSGSG